jgi:hypothetical protein
MTQDYRNYSRREFLKTTGAAGTGLLVASAFPGALVAQDAGRVPTRPFGKTGVEGPASRLGGCSTSPTTSY